jgi:putative membrane protein
MECVMKANRYFIVTAGALLVAGTAMNAWADQTNTPDQPGHVSPAPNTANDSVSAVKDAAGVTIGAASAELTTTSQGFVTAAVIGNLYEVEAAKIAAERSHDSKLQAFAAEMITAHTDALNTLKSILPGSGTEVTVPNHLDDRRQGMIDELRAAKSADFDGRYISQQVDAHREMLILMNVYAKNGDVTALKKFASDTAPVVQKHLTMAQQLYQKVSAK